MTTGAHLVALDIDGTLVHYDGSVSPPVQYEVRRAVDAGHHLVIATGRSIAGTVQVLQEFGIERGFAVCSNGAVTVELDPAARDDYRVAEAVTFDPNPVVALVRAQLPDALFAVEAVGHGIRVNRPWPEDELNGLVTIVPLEEMLREETTRVIVRSTNHTAEEFADLVRRMGLHRVAYSIGYSAWLDLAPEGVTKASALEQVRRQLAVSPEDTIAIGDGRNDLEMIRWAARGIAMGNAHDDLKAVADEICPDIREDGVAVVLAGLASPELAD